MSETLAVSAAGQGEVGISRWIDRHGPVQRAIYILFKDVDAVKKYASHGDYKYRDKASIERALTLLIRQYSLQDKRQDNTLRDLESLSFMKMLVNLLALTRHGCNFPNPAQEMWRHGSSALKAAYFDSIERHCRIYTKHSGLPAIGSFSLVYLREQVENAIESIGPRRLTLGMRDCRTLSLCFLTFSWKQSKTQETFHRQAVRALS